MLHFMPPASVKNFKGILKLQAASSFLPERVLFLKSKLQFAEILRSLFIPGLMVTEKKTEFFTAEDEVMGG